MPTRPPAPWSPLPGFAPDALGFATRTTLAMLLAYAVAFAAQVEAASTAGVCVAIVAQPSSGMSTAKAIYRVIGTLLGGAAGLALIAAFPQDRVMLLGGFALWLAACTFVATLLRDFRSYGAALSGYTAGVIAIGVIDTPQLALSTTLDRVAAILIGVFATLLVGWLLSGPDAFRALLADLRHRTAAMAELAAEALDGTGSRLAGHDHPGDDMAMVRIAAATAALQTQASYTAVELPDGPMRARGARHAIAALLAMVSASRAIAGTLGPDTPAPVRAHLQDVAAAIRGNPPTTTDAPAPTSPADALLVERAHELLASHQAAVAGLHLLADGEGTLPPIRLRASRDVVGALTGAARVLIATGAGSVFCILAGWGAATLVLIQMSAFVALLGTFPNPSRASLLFGVPLLPVALATGVVKFLLLPDASGFTMFALAVGALVFVGALAQRHVRRAAELGSTLTLFAIIFGPANPQTYDLAAYVGTVLQVALSVVFVLLSFNVIFPASPRRRLLRVVAAIAADLDRTLRDGGRPLDKAPAQSLLYDRMAHAQELLGRPTPARLHLLGHVYGMGELDLALRRAHSGLAAAAARPALAAIATRARAAVQRGDAAAMLGAAQELLDHPDSHPSRALLLPTVSGLAGAARLLRPDRATLRFHRRLTA